MPWSVVSQEDCEREKLMYVPVTVNCRLQAHDDWIENSLVAQNIYFRQRADNVEGSDEIGVRCFPDRKQNFDRPEVIEFAVVPANYRQR